MRGGGVNPPSADDVTRRPERLLMQYLDYINSDNFASDERAMDVFRSGEYAALGPLFQRVFCVPASSAPVERIFSQSGLIMRPHRAKMSDTVLEALVFLKCNSEL